MISPQERVQVSVNVEILLRNRKGQIVDTRSGHNVVTNYGRAWMSRTLSSAVFPVSTGDQTLTSNGGQGTGNTDSYSVLGKTYRPRYIGFGIGGSLQNVSPPGPGGQVEEASVIKLERAVTISKPAAFTWLKQIEPNTSNVNVDMFPDAYTTLFRAILGYDEISFATCVDELGTVWGTEVPLAEIALFTSAADSTVEPGPVQPIAYHTFRPITKTPEITLEVRWGFYF